MQTIIVSLIALVALAVVARRLLAAFRPAKGDAACPSCASGSDACATATDASPASGPAQPLVLVKPKVR